MRLSTKYQSPGPSGFRQKHFLKVLGPEAGPFWPQGYNLNTFGRGLLDKAIILRALVLDKNLF